MARVSINNGLSAVDVADLSDEQVAMVEQVIGQYTDVTTVEGALREDVHGDVAPCSPREFVAEYCARFETHTGEPLVIG